jgi:hypothetical protein
MSTWKEKENTSKLMDPRYDNCNESEEIEQYGKKGEEN